MTATTNPPETDPPSQSTRRGRSVRISYMETLGFSDSTTVWSDSPLPSRPTLGLAQPGRHEAPISRPDAMDGWTPNEIGRQLEKGNVRWTRVFLVVMLVTAMAITGFWLYERDAGSADLADDTVQEHAAGLSSQLPALSSLAEDLTSPAIPADTRAIADVEMSSRALFEAASELSTSQSSIRSAAADAASTSLDAARMLRDAIAFRRAVTPVLVPPALETDPQLIELDEAARAFGDWQIGMDSVRTSLPGGFFGEITEALDIFSGGLSLVLSDYVDALRENDSGAARAQVAALTDGLSAIEDLLHQTLVDVQSRVEMRLTDTQTSLGRLLR